MFSVEGVAPPIKAIILDPAPIAVAVIRPTAVAAVSTVDAEVTPKPVGMASVMLLGRAGKHW